MAEGSKGILVVSFGTTYEETRKKTIERIEQEIAEAFPDSRVYRAWTSNIVRRVCLKRDGMKVFDVGEALEEMKRDGIREVIVQPTHVLNGMENDRMLDTVKEYRNCFETIAVGAPLFTSQQDLEQVIEVIAAFFHPSEKESLVLMGHGTDHYANAVYAALDYQFKDLGYDNIFVGTVEGYPPLESVRKLVGRNGRKNLILAPLMIVAGDHASNDLAGEQEDSWKSVFEREGYEVSCVLRGLGEYPEIRKIFLDHVRKALPLTVQ